MKERRSRIGTLVVMGLVERGTLELATSARLLFGDNLPLVSDDETIEQFLPVLSGHKTVLPAGERFQYNNGGYVALALLTALGSGDGGTYSTAADS